MGDGAGASGVEAPRGVADVTGYIFSPPKIKTFIRKPRKSTLLLELDLASKFGLSLMNGSKVRDQLDFYGFPGGAAMSWSQ